MNAGSVVMDVSYEPRDVHFLSPCVRRNPYPYFNYLRQNAPVLWVESLNAFLISRYEDVAAIARSPQTFSSIAMRRQAPGKNTRESGTQSVITCDPPDHTRLRSLLQGEFRMRPLRELEPRIEALVQGLLNNQRSSGQIDLVADFTVPLPVTVIGELLDIEPTRHDEFKHWSDCLIQLLNDREGPQWEAARAGVFDLIDYFRALLDVRCHDAADRDDVLSVLLRAETEGQISRREIVAYATLLLTGGNETTTNLIGGMVVALRKHPDQLALLQDQPALIPNAVEEGLRYCSPVQGVYRRAMTDCEIAGTKIPAQSDVVLLLASANHDPNKFPQPESFDVNRRTGGQLGFGMGIHHCLGAHLGRLETRIALRHLLLELQNWRAGFDDVNWNPNWFVRGPNTLPFEVM